MVSRMERYDKNNNTSSSRLSKNKDLYENLYTSSSYAEFTDINSSNVIDLSKNTSNQLGRREQYQKSRNFSTTIENDRDSDDYQLPSYQYSQFPSLDSKEYDINKILNQAKQTRGEVDNLERKRKLRTTEYNILSDLTEEKLKEHRAKQRQVLTEEEKEELEDLVNTITSKTMRQEIDSELFGDLMPSKLDETVISSSLAEEINTSNIDVSNTVDNDEESDTSKLDPSFFTKSMDLSKEDLVSSLDDDSFTDKHDSQSTILKVIVAILIVAIIITIAIIIYRIL